MVKKHSSFTTPILLLIFNRPDYVERQLQALRNLAPPIVYIAADGPREGNQGDLVACQQAREMVSLIDWKCEVKTKFLPTNLGCKNAVSDAIDWFFSEVEMGVIIEDDCMADNSFFAYAQELLEKFKENKEVVHISGFNPLKHSPFSTSFSYTIHPLCWGWATWRRAWEKYDMQMADWPEQKNMHLLSKVLAKTSSVLYWEKLFDKMYRQEIDTWDYQWIYTIFKEKGLCIFPRVNLVTNIGFDQRATHTRIPFSPNSHKRAISLGFPLHYPKEIKRDSVLDDKIEEQFERAPLHKILSGLKQYFSQLNSV